MGPRDERCRDDPWGGLCGWVPAGDRVAWQSYAALLLFVSFRLRYPQTAGSAIPPKFFVPSGANPLVP